MRKLIFTDQAPPCVTRMELMRALRKRGLSTRVGLREGTNPAKDPHCTTPRYAHLVGQGWELQFSTSAAGCWATALHRAGGSVLKKPSWASTQCTSRSRRPPPQDTLHGLKSPVVQLRRKGTEHQAWDQVPNWLSDMGWKASRSVLLILVTHFFCSVQCFKLLFQNQS